MPPPTPPSEHRPALHELVTEHEAHIAPRSPHALEVTPA
jgi:hypothetical protein